MLLGTPRVASIWKSLGGNALLGGYACGETGLLSEIDGYEVDVICSIFSSSVIQQLPEWVVFGIEVITHTRQGS
ncbi:hypothetical protein [Paenibacillus sp. Soil766]|uniref:hypothetical protein n=1 Tax=Paenibacillus sp. Soil766 TaxID=1736404 RepID=UPI0012FBCBEA|nr:hypothetical protein [Paenibacillus sp. Soil766]